MKIAMIGQKGIPTKFGGIERHVEELSRRLGAMGHDVTVFTRDWYAPAQADFAPGVRTVSAPTVASKHLDAIVHTLTSTIVAIRSGVDVIHYHGVGPSLLAWIPRVFAPNIKVVSTFHCIDRKHQKWNALARFALGLGEFAACRFPHETITVSKTLQAYCRDRYDREVRYVPNGISVVEAQGAEELAQFGLVPDGYIVMVSRLVRHKGVHHLIAAYRKLQARNLTGGKKLVIVGGSAFTDDYVAEVKAQAGNDADIVFTGNLPGTGRALAQIYTNAYLVVHPSESEGLPIVVLEAMSYGKTVLASDIPENAEVTRYYGVNFRNRDVDDLAEKLARLIAEPEAVKAIGEHARDFVLADYHWDDVAKGVEHVYLHPENCVEHGVALATGNR